MNPGFLIAFLICFLGYLFHTIIAYFSYKDEESIKSKFMGIFVNVIVFLGYFAWGFMLAFDNSIIPISNHISLTIGLIMGVMGIVFIILSTIQKRGFEEIGELLKKGIYRIFRHPMYVGIVFIHIRFPFAFRRLYTLMSAII